jgi:hypothetical protein
MRPPTRAAGFLLAGAAVIASAALAQAKKGEVRALEPPWVMVGATQVLKVYGNDLPAAEVRFEDPAVQARVLKFETPGDRRRGNTVVEIEVTSSGPIRPRPQRFTLAGSDGATAEGQVLFDIPAPELKEQEPNNDLRRPQPLPGPVTVTGNLDGEGADVFRFEGKAGESWRIEVFAKRLKADNRLEAVLRLRDPALAAARTAVNHGRDCAIEYRLPRDGPYLLELFDGESQTGADLTYRLTFRRW